MRPHQEGDLASFPVTPHAEGLSVLRHADSPLRLGEMPENANQKDFIRKGHSLHVDPERELRINAARGKRQPPTRSFGTAFSEHSHEAARRLREEIRRGVANGAITRVGAAAEREAGEGAEEADGSAPALSLVSGPRPHAEVVLESEAVRGNLSGATSLARLLTSRSGAPSAAVPAPEHHFYFGGSRAQKRRLARRAENLATAREANLAMRKQRLLEDNVAELERMAGEFEEEEQARARAVAAEAAIALPRAAAEPEDVPASAASAASAASPASAPLSWAAMGVFTALLAGLAAYGIRRAVQKQKSKSRR